MNLEEIKLAIENGQTVHWSNENYTVMYWPSNDEYVINSECNDNSIGLTHQDGVTMNGEEHEFYVATVPFTMKDFRNEYALMADSYDVWGSAMECFFCLAHELYDRDEEIPAEWHYKPAAITGKQAEPDAIWYPTFQSSNSDSLLAIGKFLHRYTEYLTFKGKDY